MIDWILLGLFLLLLVYLLTAPIWLEIDTVKQHFRIRFHRLLIISLILNGETLQPEVSFLGIKRKLRADSNGEKTGLQKPQPAPKQAVDPFRLNRLPVKKLMAVLRSFRVKELVLHFDTGNHPLNGLLYPLSEWLRGRTKHDIRISFTGERKLILRVRNNLLRILWAYVRA